jgi:hypothetical protein
MTTTLSAKQQSFVSALASITKVSPVKRADLVAAAAKVGMAFPHGSSRTLPVTPGAASSMSRRSRAISTLLSLLR